MPIYHRLGKIPQKRHTIFEKPAGGYYYEQLFGTEGFHGHSSLLYHTHRPTQVKEIVKSYDVTPRIAIGKNIKALLLKGFELAPADDFLESRKAMLLNSDCIIGLAAPRQSMKTYFYKNADADELLFIHKGSGTLRTFMGNIPFEYGDYLIIPRGMIYQMEFNTADNRIFYVESHHPYYTPKRYKNSSGQLLEHSPFCERDFKLPETIETHDEKGDFIIKIKKEGMMHEVVYATHPFDVIGWDGYNFPYAFSIHNFEPITGRVHQPPPVHQTFEGPGFVVCSFVPRLFDYHPQAIPAPYNHANVDSDEVLFYTQGEFMSRKGAGIEVGSISLHPAGHIHGPQPGSVEASIGKERPDEYAVMIDTFRPLGLGPAALECEDTSYAWSWVGGR